MSNWDDEDFEPPAAVGGVALDGPLASKDWEGEDEEVKDTWDASSDEDNKKGADQQQQASGEGVKKKKTLQEKIKEREDRQRELMQKKAEAERIYTEAEKRKMQEDSDLAIAQDALGVTNLSLSSNQGLLEKFDPKKWEDFVEFRFQLTNKLLNFKDSPHFYLFSEDLFREVASCLNSEETRKLSTMLLAMSNEKVKREKEKEGGKKGKNKNKKQLKQVGNAINEYNGYGDDEVDPIDDPIGDEFDDFI